ncbi:MAG TPA: HD domain-containing protein [Ktedonobacterales bacterium]|jgi:poly(A) polymerase
MRQDDVAPERNSEFMLELLITLARLFRDNDKDLYMVGGTVRDLLLRRPTSPDIDLTTNARPDEIKRLIAQTHPDAVITVGEQFGTVRVHYRRAPVPTDTAVRQEVSPVPAALVAEASGDFDVVEITTYRSDQYIDGSRKPEVTFGDSLEGDLLRRDFTINAMARDPLSGEIVDPFGGREDLEQRLIRAVGNDPVSRFEEDPLRLLRAARFAAQLGFEIEPVTASAIKLQAPTLTRISRERIRDEFTKLLLTQYPARGLRLLVDSGLMPWIVPEVLELCGVSQKPAHSKDVYDHVLRVVERTPARPATRWAGLLHDIAKPRTRSVEDGKVHFFGHEDLGAVMARDILHRLKFDRPFIEYVSRLVKLHMRANAYLPEWTDGAVRRLMLDAGDGLHDLLDLSRADITSYRQEKVSRAESRVNDLELRCQQLREEAERVPIRSPLDGNDLMRIFGREPGPWLRPLKDYLLGLVIDGQLAPDDRDDATRLATAFLEEQEQLLSERAGEDASRGQTGQVSVSPHSKVAREEKG